MPRMLKLFGPDSMLDTNEVMGEGSQSDYTEHSSVEWAIYSWGREPKNAEKENSFKEVLGMVISFLSMKEEEISISSFKGKEVCCRCCGVKGGWIRRKKRSAQPAYSTRLDATAEGSRLQCAGEC